MKIRKFRTVSTALAAAVVVLVAGRPAHAATILKADNTAALNLTGSWVGGVGKLQE